MEPDWEDLRLVRILAAEGTLSAAARRLGIDQTTAARRLARLEKRIGEALFDRVERRLAARPLAGALAEDLDAMAAAADRIAGRLGDDRLRLTGTVVISAVDLVATRMLAPAIGAFRAAHPSLRLEIDGDDRNVSLAAREADIALRLARPEDETALTRRLGSLPFALYGPANGAATAPLAGYGDRLAHLPERRWLAATFPDEAIAFRANRAEALVEAVAGGHRAVLPCLLGDADPRLVRLGGVEPVVRREVWCLVHAARRQDAAVVAALAWIEATLRPHLR